MSDGLRPRPPAVRRVRRPRARPRASASGTRDRSSTSPPCDRSSTGRRPQRLHGPRARRLGRDPGRDRRAGRGRARSPAAPRSTTVSLHLPFAVGDYVDFYASLDHATNVGRIFRPDQEPLLPNWRHLPVGYHGRGGTVVVSGTPVVRPCGQRQVADGGLPDVRAEPAAGHRGRARLRGRRRLGARQPDRRRRALAEHVFGVVGLNDWSRPRHPGLGVRAARAVPRQVLRHLGRAPG